MSNQFRPTAIPLITTDPYFSVWSFTNHPADDHTRHWTGKQQSIFGLLSVDGVPYRFLGKTEIFDVYFVDGPALEMSDVTVTPTSSVFTFEHDACTLKVTFLSPLLVDRPEVFSRPVSYVFYEITPKEEGHTFEVYFDVSSNLCGDNAGQSISHWEKEGHAILGATEQKVLNCCGDDVRIDWGYLHLVHPNAKVARLNYRRHFFRKKSYPNTFFLTKPVPYSYCPILFATSDKLRDMFVVAYDDVHSILHYDEPVDAYYKSVYGDFDTMLEVAVKEAESLRVECAAFDLFFTEKMKAVSPAYANIGCLAYRQAVAAHKLVMVNGQQFFLSKENFSNGCIATLDVTYPSIPLFLLLNPELVRGMLRPLFEFARRPEWVYPYAPHDCGTYPFCTGQVYSTKEGKLIEDYQMPVEECGNAILCVAAVCRASRDNTFAEENKDLLKKWADYLVTHGYDPENQLCTDDFAGHLAHNCNLSLKAIVALGAYAQLFNEPSYGKIAKDMADRWTKDAKKENGIGWRLTFDKDDTWSMKYNIVWDRLLGLGLFDERISKEEIQVYTEKMNRYGVPLDSRADYTKLDWMAWTTVMTDDPTYTNLVYESIQRMICESVDRVPITDWYDTVDAREISFQARSVLGGFYINLIRDLF